jgi:DNA-binding NarL/FixJ family response regulator
MLLSSPSLAAGHPDMLSTIETRVLLLYAAGFTRSEIARETGLSAHTIGHYLTTAKDKLQARSLAHAVYLFTRSRT